VPVATGELDEIADQRRQLFELGTDIGQQLVAIPRVEVVMLGPRYLSEQIEVGTQTGQWRTQLVSGSATSCRCRSATGQGHRASR